MFSIRIFFSIVHLPPTSLLVESLAKKYLLGTAVTYKFMPADAESPKSSTTTTTGESSGTCGRGARDSTLRRNWFRCCRLRSPEEGVCDETSRFFVQVTRRGRSTPHKAESWALELLQLTSGFGVHSGLGCSDFHHNVTDNQIWAFWRPSLVSLPSSGENSKLNFQFY